MNKTTTFLLTLAIPLLTIGAGCSMFTKDTQTSQTLVVPVANAESTVTTTNEFKLSDLKVGLEIAGLKVTSFGPFDAKSGPMSAENLTVAFAGTKTVSGVYSGTEDSAMGGPASFSVDDAASQSLPQLASDSDIWFSFNDLESTVVAKLGKVKKPATIVIKNYTINSWPAEVSNTADLVEVKETVSSAQPLPATCVDQAEAKAVITSLSSNSGPVGTKLEIKGCNFAGFEGDTNAIIESSKGVIGILYGESGSTAKVIKVTLKSPLCSQDNSYSGLPCKAYLTLTPGTYKIYTIPWGVNTKSNFATFIIQ